LTDTGFNDFSGIWIDSDLCLSNGYFGFFRLMPKSTSINFWNKDRGQQRLGKRDIALFFIIDIYGPYRISDNLRKENILERRW
jgi:hypothetical protein